MGALKFISWDYFCLVFFNLNEGLISLSDLCFGYTLGANVIIGSFLSVLFVRNLAFIFTLKLTLSIMFLILIRGGTPRYRYDYLTKLGWLKFFGLTVVFFLTLLFIYFVF